MPRRGQNLGIAVVLKALRSFSYRIRRAVCLAVVHLPSSATGELLCDLLWAKAVLPAAAAVISKPPL